MKPVRKRRPRQLKLFERDRPGDSVQVDVKFVRVGGQRLFQCTALDDYTRYRVLRLFWRLPMPTLGLTLPVTVHLVIEDGATTECWQTTYTTPIANDTSRIAAKGP